MPASGQAPDKGVKEDAVTSEVSASRIALRIAMAFLGLSAALFGSAGTIAWLQAWLYVVIQFSFWTGMALWLKKHNPPLLRERMALLKPATKGWDKIFFFTSTMVLVPYLLLPGLDAVRYQWSSVPVPIAVAGFAGVIASLLLISSVLRVNTYLSRVVEIQRERGHKVITSGPYRYVRHPMYVGLVILFFSIPVALGSLWTLIPASILSLLIVIRTHFEDKTLHEELEGYRAYAEKVRYRLLPGLW